MYIQLAHQGRGLFSKSQRYRERLAEIANATATSFIFYFVEGCTPNAAKKLPVWRVFMSIPKQMSKQKADLTREIKEALAAFLKHASNFSYIIQARYFSQ